MAGVRSLSSLAGESESTGVELICHLETEAVYTLDRPERSYSGIDQAPAGWGNFVEPVRGRSPAISAYRIRECLVTPNAAVMTANGSFVQESLFPYVRWGDIQTAFEPFILGDADGEGLSLRLSGLTRIREPVFFAREHGEAGYFHWLHSIIPRTTLYAALDGAPRRLLVALTAPYQHQSLAALGWPRDRTLEADGNTAACDELIFISPMVRPDLERSGGFFERTLVSNKILRGLAVKAKIKPVGRRLFVSRADASIRRLLSEAAVIKALKPVGFEAVALEGTPFAQQVESFGQADCVVGVHGAGLSNIAFMRPGGTVVEILTPGRLWPTYRGVAARSGLTYYPYLGRSAGLELQNDSDVDLDADHFTAFVTEIASRGSPGEERDGSLRSLRD